MCILPIIQIVCKGTRFLQVFETQRKSGIGKKQGALKWLSIFKMTIKQQQEEKEEKHG